MNRLKPIAVLLLAAIALSALIAYGVHRNVLGPAEAREAAFSAIQSGNLPVGPDGVVALPPKWSTASIDATAYVTRSEHATWALFVKERGFDGRFTGDLFCDQPAKAMAKGVLEINGPVTTPSARVGLMEVRVVRVLNPWSFEVMREAVTDPYSDTHVPRAACPPVLSNSWSSLGPL